MNWETSPSEIRKEIEAERREIFVSKIALGFVVLVGIAILIHYNFYVK